MTDSAKTTLWVIIILVLVGGIWWFVGSNPDSSQNLETSQVQQVADVQATTTTVVEAPIEDASTSISIQDKTDATLNADLSKVDDQLKVLDTVSSN